MVNTIGSLLIAAAAGGFYFQDNKVLAALCIITAFLFAIGYFDPDRVEKKNKKSVM